MRNSGPITYLLTTVICCCLSLPVLGADADPIAREGLVDLSGWDFDRDGNVELKGEYEFYWNRFLNRHELLTEQAEYFAEVPAPWNGTSIEDETVDRHGFATYRLNILIPPEQPRLSLKLLDFGTAARVFVDGEMMLKMGHPGIRERSTQGRYKPSIIDFRPKGNRVELVIHVANFNHRNGGIWQPILLGTSEKIHLYSDQQIAFELLLFGALVMIAIYNLAFFALRPEGYSNLFLSLFCLSASIRILSVNERFLLRVFPDIEWVAFTKIEYLSWYLLIPAFAHFLISIFPREVDRRVVYAIDGVSLLAVAIVLVTPLAVYSFTAPFMQVIHIAVLVYGAFCLLMARRNRREGANLLLFGYLFLFACALNDLLAFSWIIDSPSLVDIGIVAFAICQSIHASFDFALSVQTVERQHQQLATTSLKLQTQEKLRLEAEIQSRKVSARFRESQQFEALGILAHGVVSDLKESFAEASEEAEVLAEALKSNPTLLASLNKTRETADHSVAVIEDLLSLSTFNNEQHTTDVNFVINDLMSSPKIMDQAILKNVNLDSHLTESIQPVAGSKLHVQRILENLLSNALDSHPSGGSTLVSSEQIYTDGRTLFYDNLDPGYFVVIGVEDKGSGIHPEDLDSIFQPFFSRGEVRQKNMGLGMSVVRAIVRQLGGGIDVISEMGQGTRFDIYLPVAITSR
ncbi:MAG: hypothetical protein HOC70_16710 [Gammaproteobacteria bacterium]|jgi:signal transduction histidine kinase|nr:hypothetical protein [Gammaproteobacteria bacterium]MBT7371883.1 hypothetical protein [Gammaproteobacteria bacterium]